MGNSVDLEVPVWVTFEWDAQIEYEYKIPIPYNDNCKIQHLISSKIPFPKQYQLEGYKLKIEEIKKESFLVKRYNYNEDKNQWNYLLQESITNYNKNSITNNGLHIIVTRIIEITITAKCHMEPLLETTFILATKTYQSITQIINHIINTLNEKYFPTKVTMDYIKNDSFFEHKIDENNLNEFVNKTVSNYDINNIKNKGIVMVIKIKPYKYITNKKKCNIQTCVIYNQMIKNESTDCINETNINHLTEFNHSKIKCPLKICSIYNKLLRGNTNLYQDILKIEGHLKLYAHKTRKQRFLALSQHWESFFVAKKFKQHKLYRPSPSPAMIFDSYCSTKDDQLNGLITEIISNGFKSDLGMEIKMDNESDAESCYEIMKLVEYKLNCMRHKRMGLPLNKSQMLSLILYTSSNCGSINDLCQSQMNGDYKKWKWLDFCLYRAINRLSTREYNDSGCKLYVFMDDVKMEKKLIENGYFVTYMSAYTKLNDGMDMSKGVILESDEMFRDNSECCDVSWISMFDNECEVVIGRSIFSNNFQCKLLDENDGLQKFMLSNPVVVKK